MTYGGEPNWVDKVGFGAVIFALAILFIALMQPVWRGDEMAAEFKSDCSKRGGVLLEHKKMFGTSYECASRLDK